MKSPDVVFRELGQLYDFYREIAKFRFKSEGKKGSDESPKQESPHVHRKLNPEGDKKGDLDSRREP